MNLSLLFLVVTAILAIPVPYYFLKESTFRQDYSFARDERNSKLESFTLIAKRLLTSILVFGIVFGLNYLIFFLSNETETLKIYLLFFIVPIILNMFYLHEFYFTKNESKILILFACGLLLTLILPLHDLVFRYTSVETVPTLVREYSSPLLDFETLKIRYDISEFKKSYYDFETSSYVHISNENHRNQIIIVSSESVTTINCNLLPDISLLRNEYPSESFKFTRIDFKDEYNPVAVYELLERETFFSKPYLKKMVCVNLQSGKIEDYISNK